MRAIAIAPAKVILVGEHFVVAGKRALAMAVNLYSEVSVKRREDSVIHVESRLKGVAGSFLEDSFKPEVGGAEAEEVLRPFKMLAEAVVEHAGAVGVGINIDIRSMIPVGVGLGSSAATSVSTIGAIAKLLRVKLSRREICDLAYVSEKHIHGKPSGIDQTTSTYGGIVSYSPKKGLSRLEARRSIPLVVGNTGVTRSTGELVSKVRETLARKSFGKDLLRLAERISVEAAEAVKRGDIHRLGRLMNRNQQLLTKVGVSTAELDELVNAAMKAGALGAKLTGAGGGGCMIALAEPRRLGVVAEAIEKAGGEAYIVHLDRRGLRSKLQKDDA